MENRQHDLMRQQMIAEVVADAVFLTPHLGKAALDSRVIEVMGRIPRHEFVPVELQAYSYINAPLPVGYGKTVSQPFIIALMTDMLDIQPEDTVLEIGTGLGYQATIAASLARKVYSVEVIEELSQQARDRLKRLGIDNVELRIGNGCFGWAEHAPFDKIIVTAAPDLIPPALLAQLRPGGRMAIPAGLPDAQQLLLVVKDTDGMVTTKEVLPVRFSQLEGTESDAPRRDVQ